MILLFGSTLETEDAFILGARGVAGNLIDRRASFDRGIMPALLALAAQLLFGAVALQPGLATMAASPICEHAAQGSTGSHNHGAPPAQSISPLLLALTIPAPTHVPPPVLPVPGAEFTRIHAVVPQDDAPHDRARFALRARGPPAFT